MEMPTREPPEGWASSTPSMEAPVTVKLATTAWTPVAGTPPAPATSTVTVELAAAANGPCLWPTTGW